jgi:hypothetical protein
LLGSNLEALLASPSLAIEFWTYSACHHVEKHCCEFTQTTLFVEIGVPAHLKSPRAGKNHLLRCLLPHIPTFSKKLCCWYKNHIQLTCPLLPREDLLYAGPCLEGISNNISEEPQIDF